MAEKIRQHPEFVAVARHLLARIGDQALAFDDPGVVEQHRGHHREFVRRRTGVHPDLGLEVEGACPVLELVVIFEIDFAEAIGAGSALFEFGETRERERRRPAVGAACIIDELVRDRRGGRADMNVPDVEPLGPVLRMDLLHRNQPDHREREP